MPDQDLHRRASATRTRPGVVDGPRHLGGRTPGSGRVPGQRAARALVSRQAACWSPSSTVGTPYGAPAIRRARPARTARQPACRRLPPGAPDRCCPPPRTPAPASTAASSGKVGPPGQVDAGGRRPPVRREPRLGRPAGDRQPASRPRPAPRRSRRHARRSGPGRHGGARVHDDIRLDRRRAPVAGHGRGCAAGRRHRSAGGRRPPPPGRSAASTSWTGRPLGAGRPAASPGSRHWSPRRTGCPAIRGEQRHRQRTLVEGGEDDGARRTPARRSRSISDLDGGRRRPARGR